MQCQLAKGLPQGPLLGPVLWCTYILQLGDPFAFHNLSYQLYADDTLIYFEVDDILDRC